MHEQSLAIGALRDLYQSGVATPAQVIESVYQRISVRCGDHVWISLVPREQAMARAYDLGTARDFPLYGIPFAVKDNIDVAGMQTTAACPAFGYTAEKSAVIVDSLLRAGAILVGKTNLDQFATGLVGVRSPYGVPRNPFDAKYIPGGSSAGSAVSVASGLVSFALGTDTAGSGRVPAALNNIVGWKPTVGALSATGVVPACRSIHCMSVFALTPADAGAVSRVAMGFDSLDPFSRRPPAEALAWPPVSHFRYGVPREDQMQFFSNTETPALFDRTIQALDALGGVRVTVDYGPFREAAALLYEGPWVAERTVSLDAFQTIHADALHPVTRSILTGAAQHTAEDAFRAVHRLAELKRQVEPVWDEIETLVLPTTATTYTVAEVEADPIALNTNLGYYTNFVNLLDCCGVAVPSGFTTAGLPFGVTLVGPAWRDGTMLAIADRLHRSLGLRLGATSASASVRGCDIGLTPLAVVGEHMRGQPLERQLRDLGGRFARACRTAGCYRLYVLAGTDPPTPSLARVAEGGVAIEIEVWELPSDALGRLISMVPAPHAVGSVVLESGERVSGFVCEPIGIADAREITCFGGWRAFCGAQ
jgi:allophanate hydrolase